MKTKKYKWGKPMPLSEMVKLSAKMANKKPSLKESLLLEDDEEATIFEDGDTNGLATTPDQPLEVQNISLDKKMDHFMIQYERESIPTSAIYQEPNLNPMEVPEPAYRQSESRTLSRLASILLKEADDDPAADAGADAGGGATGGDDAGAGGTDPNKRPDVKPPTINVQNFARSMARLISNYETLCDPKSTMINRASAYLRKNYDPNMSKEFMIILETQYDLTPRVDGDHEVTPGPPAAGAWPGSGGGT